jgi:hypothetical protein
MVDQQIKILGMLSYWFGNLKKMMNSDKKQQLSLLKFLGKTKHWQIWLYSHLLKL